MDLSTADLTTTGGMATVAIIFAALGFLKGLVRFVFSLLAIAVGIIAGFWGYRNGESLASKIIESPEPWMSYVVALVIGIGVHSVAKTILGFLTGSFNDTATARKLGFGAPAGVFGLLTGLLFSGLGLSGIKYAGSVAELQHLSDHVNLQEAATEDPPLLMQLKGLIENSKPGQWHTKLDPFNDKATLNLAKLFVLRQSPYHATRAASSRDARRVLGQPDVTQLLITDRDTANLAKEQKFLSLLNSADIRKIAGIPAAEEALLASNIEKALGLE